jgi:dienelactone hydrolase
MQNSGTGPAPPELGRNMPLLTRDYARERPASDQLFEAYRSQYLYDKTDLRAVVESTDDSAPNWRRERITFNAAYEGDRVIAQLYLPKSAVPPYQTVVVFPANFGFRRASSDTLSIGLVVPEYLLLSGRAVIVPIYKGTFERYKGELTTGYARDDRLYRNLAIQWVQDVMRSIDYLETRPDIDVGKLAFHGASWGGPQGAVVPAVEPRLATSVLLLAGLPMQRSLPEVDPINFVGRVRIPTLLLGAEYDFAFPVQASQRPMFALLGTPVADKRHVVFDGAGHDVSTARRNAVIRETLAWLDKYLGQVR